MRRGRQNETKYYSSTMTARERRGRSRVSVPHCLSSILVFALPLAWASRLP